MERILWKPLSRLAAGVVASRFAKPTFRIALAATGLLLLAFIGRSAMGGALASSGPGDASSAHAQGLVALDGKDATCAAEIDGASPTPASVIPSSPLTQTALPPGVRVRASAEDPVILNTATEADLKRLSGIGPKRAEAILALRGRLGRFHAVEDLLKVKGIGRATLKRLRPMLRVD